MRRKIGSLILAMCVAFWSLFLFPELKVSAAYLLPAGTTRYHVIDISHYNTITWSALPGDLAAIYMKATEGSTNTDPTIASNVAGAQGRGFKYGFYHFLHPNTDQNAVEQQAVHFYDTIKNYGYTCLPALDVEATDGYDNETLVKSIHTFINKFQALSGQPLMIYANVDYINNHFQNDGTLTQQRLWLADYGGNYVYPETPHSSNGRSFDNVNIWSVWDMWQYAGTSKDDPTSGMTISGISGLTDGDWATDGIFLTTPDTLSSVDSPKENVTYSGYLTISGWELARTGVSRVDFYVDDNQWLGSTNQLYARDDVQKACNKSGYYLNPSKCGFAFTFYSSALSSGKHTLIVAGISNDGTVQWDRRTFYTKGNSITDIDAPQSTTYYGNIPLGGWMLNSSGQQRVDFYLDGNKWLGSNNGVFLPRPDVQAARNSDNSYPQGALYSGYSFTIPASSVTPGTHTVNVAGIGKNGSVEWSARTFTVASSSTCIDSPSGTVSGNISISGWALSHAGVARVDIYAFDSANAAHFLGSVSSGALTARADVQKAFPAYATLNSGYRLSADTTGLKAGPYTLSVANIGKDGSVQWQTKSITVVPSPLTDIDAPSSGSALSGTVTVKGWALNHSGIARLDAYLFNSSGVPTGIGSVDGSAFTMRSDVAKIYANKGYGNLNANAYIFSFNTAGFRAGSYTLSVAAIGKDGDVKWETKNVTIR